MAKYSNPKYEFNIMDYGIDVPRSSIEDAREAVREFVLDKVLQYIAEGKSPVSGEGNFRGLKKSYKKVKEEVSGSTDPNLELYGDMLDALDIKINGNKLILLVSDSSQKGKSEGHNQFETDGPPGLVKRRFIPNEEDDQRFKKDIENGIRETLMDYAEENNG